ncbi:hypothetical protein MSAR_34020 [Mycolicibacterium sarraceniae]|uniref:Uncharacterized protein n=1 Tax=Mycolicibacterium sarraceniae TaxID=1534348 RepID=A0A7I7SWT5_9MYCO|nr:hypothetical protein MSAR_34020 [Mycolicibacterium sarraceniae]
MRAVRVEAIEQFRKKVDETVAGDNIGLLFSSLQRSELSPGAVLTSAVRPDRETGNGNPRSSSRGQRAAAGSGTRGMSGEWKVLSSSRASAAPTQ